MTVILCTGGSVLFLANGFKGRSVDYSAQRYRYRSILTSAETFLQIYTATGYAVSWLEDLAGVMHDWHDARNAHLESGSFTVPHAQYHFLSNSNVHHRPEDFSVEDGYGYAVPRRNNGTGGPCLLRDPPRSNHEACSLPDLTGGRIPPEGCIIGGGRLLASYSRSVALPTRLLRYSLYRVWQIINSRRRKLHVAPQRSTLESVTSLESTVQSTIHTLPDYSISMGSIYASSLALLPPRECFHHCTTLDMSKVVVATIVVYDFVSNLDDEINYLLNSRTTLAKGLFLGCRYIPFVILTLHVAMAFSWGVEACLWLAQSNILFLGILLLCAECIFVLRTYALWNRDRHVRKALLIFFLALLCGVITLLVACGIRLKKSIFTSSCYSSTPIPVSFILTPYIILLLLEIEVVCLTFYRIIRYYRATRCRLLTLVTQHSVGYIL
ncbi:uncharacterized protein EDB91DRAFT_1335281, partial [Suillus paluster]|uniref:uncharacterized protein n=1 Tax=Suillus paluster TaxID=48578 RepID=UPI001B863EC1